MSGFEIQFERFEFKYLIDEGTAARVRRDIARFCSPDRHNYSPDRDSYSPDRHNYPNRGPGTQRGDATRQEPFIPGYPISSLYLDSAALAFFEAKERGDPERIKLRVRTYPRAHTQEAPIAVMELKRRVRDVIDKTRTIVPIANAEEAARGVGPEAAADSAAFLNRFARVVAQSGAEPKLHVFYRREAYTSEVDHYARVTFDRDLRAQAADGWELQPPDERWCHLEDYWRPELRHRNVVLELKCQSFVPAWIIELVRNHALKRVSLSKYSLGIHVTGRENGFQRLARRSARVLM